MPVTRRAKLRLQPAKSRSFRRAGRFLAAAREFFVGIVWRWAAAGSIAPARCKYYFVAIGDGGLPMAGFPVGTLQKPIGVNKHVKRNTGLLFDD
ncbi:hypothetical protein QT971_07850 [Microcoleus sp. herbarium19]|uniref:hypothetical protein n=1 Tax=unclassified Microcoleus TaxID=2642155 RepID=UPI002FD5EFE4